jgi:hypothetical protein
MFRVFTIPRRFLFFYLDKAVKSASEPKDSKQGLPDGILVILQVAMSKGMCYHVRSRVT